MSSHLASRCTPGAASGARRPRRPLLACMLVLLAAGAAVAAIKLDLTPLLATLSEQTKASRITGWVFLLIYVVLLMIPFVPGAEIGLALLVIFGAAMAWPVYIATVLALSVAFAAGRLAYRFRNHTPPGNEPPTSDDLDVLAGQLRNQRWIQPLMRFRWLAVIALINMPGSIVIGGGGGIAMAIGYSRALSFPAFLACVAIAVAPVPALVLVAEHVGFGERLEDWIRNSL